jgi:hypothetical protein
LRKSPDNKKFLTPVKFGNGLVQYNMLCEMMIECFGSSYNWFFLQICNDISFRSLSCLLGQSELDIPFKSRGAIGKVKVTDFLLISFNNEFAGNGDSFTEGFLSHKKRILNVSLDLFRSADFENEKEEGKVKNCALAHLMDNIIPYQRGILSCSTCRR